MENINENEQWRSGGDCSKCRKQNYCSNKCRQYHERSDKMFRSLMKKSLNDKGLGVLAKFL